VEVIDVFTWQRDAAREVDALELIGAEHHVILHVRGGGVLELELPGGNRQTQHPTAASRR
jgi:hypothetical protein